MENILSQEELSAIEAACRKYGLKDYHIQNDGLVNVTGYVDLSNYKFTEIPIKFNRVSGNFNMSSTYVLTLHGCPKYVGGDFTIEYGYNLTSLEGGPEEVDGSFFCQNTPIISLKGAPKTVRHNFRCDKTRISNLIGISYVEKGDIICGSKMLRSFEGLQDIVPKDFRCEDSNIQSLEFAPSEVGSDFIIHNCQKLTSLMGMPKIVNGELAVTYCVTLRSTVLPYTVKFGSFRMANCRLPMIFRDNFTRYDLLFKYQNYYDIWNDKGKLNETGAKEFMEDLAEGLE